MQAGTHAGTQAGRPGNSTACSLGHNQRGQTGKCAAPLESALCSMELGLRWTGCRRYDVVAQKAHCRERGLNSVPSAPSVSMSAGPADTHGTQQKTSKAHVALPNRRAGNVTVSQLTVRCRDMRRTRNSLVDLRVASRANLFMKECNILRRSTAETPLEPFHCIWARPMQLECGEVRNFYAHFELRLLHRAHGRRE